jgi:hypothetical protein
MKSRSLSFAAGVLMLVALVLVWRPWSPEDHPSDDFVAPRKATTTTSQDISTAPSIAIPDGRNNKQRDAASPIDKEGVLNEIHDASVTYDPSQLPKIAAFLHHADEQIRQAAIDGMIVLGDSAAAPILREAAKTALSAKEAVALEEAAAYMELPSARNVLRSKEKKPPTQSPDPIPR